jgi:hypothetical protein
MIFLSQISATFRSSSPFVDHLLYDWTETITTEAPKEEPAPEVKDETKQVEETKEEEPAKKSMFATLCGCLSPAAKTDTKEVPAKETGEDDEKEETEDKPADPAEA